MADQRSSCPIARALDLIGDRWTLLVIRDLMFTDKKRYRELLGSAERIPTNILADRLRRLESAGIVQKSAYQERPVRYEYALTKKGIDLFEVLAELIRWGREHLPECMKIPERSLAMGRPKVKQR